MEQVGKLKTGVCVRPKGTHYLPHERMQLFINREKLISLPSLRGYTRNINMPDFPFLKLEVTLI